MVTHIPVCTSKHLDHQSHLKLTTVFKLLITTIDKSCRKKSWTNIQLQSSIEMIIENCTGVTKRHLMTRGKFLLNCNVNKIILDSNGKTMVKSKLSIENMESIRDQKLFRREELNGDMILKVLHKVTIKIQSLGTAEAEKQDVPISL